MEANEEVRIYATDGDPTGLKLRASIFVGPHHFASINEAHVGQKTMCEEGSKLLGWKSLPETKQRMYMNTRSFLR